MRVNQPFNKLIDMKKIFILLLFATILFTGCKKEDPPIANFTAKSSAYLTESVSFRSTSENADKITWEFGDGKTAIGESVQHAYQESGMFNVKLTAENEGGKDTYSQSITISIGKAEFNITNKTSWGIYLLSCKWGDPDVEFTEYGYIASGTSTEFVQTNQSQIGLGGKANGIVFVCAYPFSVVNFTKNRFAIYDTTHIYTGNQIVGIDKSISVQIKDLPAI